MNGMRTLTTALLMLLSVFLGSMLPSFQAAAQLAPKTATPKALTKAAPNTPGIPAGKANGSAAPKAAPAAKPAPPPPDYRLAIPFEEYKLPNGLRVVLSRDNVLPVVAVAMVYDVGSRSEEKGHTGYVHLFEHMMGESPANVGKGEYSKYIRTAGGRLNGVTRPGYSMFTMVAPSNQLMPALWMEAGRMGGLVITPETLKERQDAIREERVSALQNAGYNAAVLEGWQGLVFQNIQTTHSLFGSPQSTPDPKADKNKSEQHDDVLSATVEDVTNFYKTWYAPNNAILAVAGDFQPADIRKAIEQYFGGIPAQPAPQRPDVTEPPRTEGRTRVIQDSHIGAPAVIIGWPAPARHSPEWSAVQILDALLTEGLTARIPSNLVQGRKSILQFQTGIGWPFDGAAGAGDPSEYGILAIYRPGLRPQLIQSEIQQELDDIARGIDLPELSRAKAALRLQKVTRLQSSLERATLLAQYELLDGKASMIDEDFLNLMAVKPVQVQTAAKRILTAARRDAIFIDFAPRPAPRPAPQPAK
jgi:zinc protease